MPDGQLSGAHAVAREDRLEERLVTRQVLGEVDAVEEDAPDPPGEVVVLAERRLEVVVARAGVDRRVDLCVEADQLRGVGPRVVEAAEELADDRPVRLRGAFGGARRREPLQLAPDVGQEGVIGDVDLARERAAAR